MFRLQSLNVEGISYFMCENVSFSFLALESIHSIVSIAINDVIDLRNEACAEIGCTWSVSFNSVFLLYVTACCL